MTVKELRAYTDELRKLPQPKFIVVPIHPDSILGREVYKNVKESAAMTNTVISPEMNDAAKKKDL